jgi:hypothetical protein
VGLLESIRKWIDGEVADDPLAEVGENEQPRRIWEEFLVRIAREVELVMQREMFTPPGGPTFIPREYIVYLSNEDDHEWRGEKRRGLEQGLYHVLSERARELSGSTQLATKSFAVELRVDGTLEKGQFRVQHVWDETESGHTMVTPRLSDTMMPGATSAAGDGSTAVPAGGNGNEEETEITRVTARKLFNIEVWRGGVRQFVFPATKAEISIGRGSRSVPVDLPIKDDPEVSRLHAVIQMDTEGKFWLLPKGRNLTLVAGREAPREERTPIAPDDKIDICSYSLRVQP